MADHVAPGYEPRQQDHKCYNCGVHGHLFNACPEDARLVPAGLEASRKRQTPGTDKQSSRKRSRAPVVTHYPIPPSGAPSHGPFPPPYDAHHAQDGYYQSQIPGAPASHPYPGSWAESFDHHPPLSTSQFLPHNSSYAGPRGPYENPTHNPWRGPPGAHQGSSHFDQISRHNARLPPSIPTPPAYSGHPSRYENYPSGLPRAPPAVPPYQPPPPPSYEHPFPPPGVGSYPQSSYANYPPPPPGYHGPPPQHAYPPVHVSPPPGPYSHPPPSLPPPPPSLPTYHPPENRVGDRPFHEPHRGDVQRRFDDYRHSRHKHNRGNDQSRRRQSPHGRGHQNRRGKDKIKHAPSPSHSTPSRLPSGENNGSTINRVSEDRKEAEKPVEHRDDESNTSSVDFEWDKKTIFEEPKLEVTKDLIKEPLPLEWTDAPMIPPVYDRPFITSKYITPSNVDDFALSVRETRAWKVLQYHPVFRQLGHCLIEGLEGYEKALNPSKQVRHSDRQLSRSIPSGPRLSQQNSQSFPRHRDGIHVPHDRHGFNQSVSKKRSWDQSYNPNAEQSAESKPSWKKPKMLSPEPGEVLEGDDRPRFELDDVRNIKASKDGQSYGLWKNLKRPNNHGPRSSNGKEEPSNSPARSSSPPFSPSPPSPAPRIASRQSCSPSPNSGQSRQSSRQTSRHSSPSSPLTPNERELLGLLSDDSDTGKDSPVPVAPVAPVVEAPKPKLSSIKIRKRAPKVVAAAYQRRW